ncbi:helicase associated domain-containing protein [Streptomyces sp. NPDC048279]|uniref:helicase associated domain-containing protein n=1 Tax=Streptomyces sp. NPDC048279 TaxID=3154714 RepID=UPI00343194CD
MSRRRHPRSRDAWWETNLAAARQFPAREGHLQVPRQHVEITGDNGGDRGEQAAVRLGAWLGNTPRSGREVESGAADTTGRARHPLVASGT